MKRKKKYNDNLFKAYAELWERCSKGMKAKIEARKDYEATIYNNPIELIKSIKEHALSYEETQCDKKIILNVFRAYLNCRQREDESLQDYT